MKKVKEIDCVEINGVYVPKGEVRTRTESSSTVKSKKPIHVKMRPSRDKVTIVSPRYRHQKSADPVKEFAKGFNTVANILNSMGKF